MRVLLFFSPTAGMRRSTDALQSACGASVYLRESLADLAELRMEYAFLGFFARSGILSRRHFKRANIETAFFSDLIGPVEDVLLYRRQSHERTVTAHAGGDEREQRGVRSRVEAPYQLGSAREGFAVRVRVRSLSFR